jgi:hypothetical protein
LDDGLFEELVFLRVWVLAVADADIVLELSVLISGYVSGIRT